MHINTVESKAQGPKVVGQEVLKVGALGESWDVNVTMQFHTSAARDGFFAAYTPQETLSACLVGTVLALVEGTKPMAGKHVTDPLFFVGYRNAWGGRYEQQEPVQPSTWLVARHEDLAWKTEGKEAGPTSASLFHKTLLLYLSAGGEVRVSITPSSLFRGESRTGACAIRSCLAARVEAGVPGAAGGMGKEMRVLSLSAGAEARDPAVPASFSHEHANALLQAVEEQIRVEMDDMPMSTMLMQRGAAVEDPGEPTPAPAPKGMAPLPRTEAEAGFYLRFPSRILSRWIDRIFGLLD